MKPKPLVVLKNFTVPVAIGCLPLTNCPRGPSTSGADFEGNNYQSVTRRGSMGGIWARSREKSNYGKRSIHDPY
jgi:hypothetical protein